MDPINYLPGGGQVDLGKSLLTGLSAANTIQALQNDRADRAQRQMMLEQAQEQAQAQAQLQQEQMRQSQELEMQREQARRAAVSPSASAADRLNYLSLVDPKQAEQLNKVFEGMDKQALSNNLRTVSQTATLLNSSNPEFGVKNLEYMIEAAKNAGDTEEVNRLTQFVDASKINPRAVADQMATIAGSMGEDGKRFFEAYTNSLSMRSKAEEQEAKTKTEGVTAKYAEAKAISDLEKQGWDVKKIKADINYNEAQSKINAMNAEAASTNNDLKRQELELRTQELKQKIEDNVNAKIAEYEDAKGSIKNLQATVQKALLFSDDVFNSATGPVESRLFTIDQDVADFEETINAIRNQVFLAMVPRLKGTGALTQQEGERLEAALASVNLRQSPGQLKANLRLIYYLMNKATTNLNTRYGAPPTPKEPPQKPPAPPQKPPAPAPKPSSVPKNLTVDY